MDENKEENNSEINKNELPGSKLRCIGLLPFSASRGGVSNPIQPNEKVIEKTIEEEDEEYEKYEEERCKEYTRKKKFGCWMIFLGVIAFFPIAFYILPQIIKNTYLKHEVVTRLENQYPGVDFAVDEIRYGTEGGGSLFPLHVVSAVHPTYNDKMIFFTDMSLGGKRKTIYDMYEALKSSQLMSNYFGDFGDFHVIYWVPLLGEYHDNMTTEELLNGKDYKGGTPTMGITMYKIGTTSKDTVTESEYQEIYDMLVKIRKLTNDNLDITIHCVNDFKGLDHYYRTKAGIGVLNMPFFNPNGDVKLIFVHLEGQQLHSVDDIKTPEIIGIYIYEKEKIK